MLSYAKSGTARTGDRLNGFNNGKTQQFNSGGVVKWANSQKKWSPFKDHRAVRWPLARFCIKTQRHVGCLCFMRVLHGQWFLYCTNFIFFPLTLTEKKSFKTKTISWELKLSPQQKCNVLQCKEDLNHTHDKLVLVQAGSLRPLKYTLHL